MSGITLMEQIIRKMGLQDDPRVLEKATELLRLLQLKSSKVVAGVGDYGKITICIDLATTVLGMPFDLEIGLKASGLRKTAYVNYKRTFEKILDLNKPPGINEICVRLGLNEVSHRAQQLLAFYKETLGDKSSDVDLSHPQYPAMAVYQACRLEKKKFPKSKIIEFSHLKPAQWTKLEQQWERLVKTNGLASKEQKPPESLNEPSPKKAKIGQKNIVGKLKENEVEDYETWKSKMLAFANLELERGLTDKENKG